MAVQKAKDELQKYLTPRFVKQLEISTWDDFCDSERWNCPIILRNCFRAPDNKGFLKETGGCFITDADLLEKFVRNFDPRAPFAFLYRIVEDICARLEPPEPRMRFHEKPSNPSTGPNRIFNDGRMAEGQRKPIPLPAVLYHPGILRFAQYCTRSVETVSQEVRRCAAKLQSEITKYGLESSRSMSTPFSLLCENLGVNVSDLGLGKTKPDVMIVNSKNELLVVIEQKKIGGGGFADLQGATYVTNYINLAEKKQEKMELFDRYASFVITIEGTTVSFFAVSLVGNGKEANLELLRICSGLFMPEDPDCDGRRHGDLLVTLQALRDVFQEGLIEEKLRVISENLAFPYILHFESPDAFCEDVVLNHEVKMQAIGLGGRVVSRLQRQSMKYLATTTKGQKVFVRFDSSYGIDAHKSAAVKGIAPQLLGVTTVHLTEKAQGDRYVGVVMEWLDDYKRFREAFSMSKEDRIEIVVGLRKAFAALRDCGVIHGDLRPPNILWRSADDGTIDVKFVDFEWACLESEPSVYPGVLNDDILWPKGAKQFSIMKVKHDNSFVERICGALLDDNPIDPTERRVISSKRSRASTSEESEVPRRKCRVLQ